MWREGLSQKSWIMEDIQPLLETASTLARHGFIHRTACERPKGQRQRGVLVVSQALDVTDTSLIDLGSNPGSSTYKTSDSRSGR